MAEIRIERDGDLYSAYCDKLGLASCGTTKDSAVTNLEHVYTAYCRALNKRGILQERLREKGMEG